MLPSCELALSPGQLQPIVAPLLGWYNHSARILPWRENTDPYRVWVSEIMLQQTRVEAVKPYYERFLLALPTVQALAEAEESLLLKLWEGLGYYNRVRNLQKAARVICGEHGGAFPSDFEQIRALPGIGEYTAGAICSISFGQPRAAVDGNVLRVAARLLEDGRDPKAPAYKRELTAALEAVYPAGRCGDFTQSLMELGAMICLPGSPKCALCPLAALCKANQNGTQELYPIKSVKKARRKETRTVFLLTCDGRLALCRRESKGLLAGLWELPNAVGALTDDEILAWLRGAELDALSIAPFRQERHIFTHIEWDMRGIAVRCKEPNPRFVWANAAQLQQEYALPTAFKKLLVNFDPMC